MPNAGQDLHTVCLYSHPSAPAVPHLTPSQLVIDVLRVDRNPGRNAFKDADKSLAMGFTCSKVPDHDALLFSKFR